VYKRQPRHKGNALRREERGAHPVRSWEIYGDSNLRDNRISNQNPKITKIKIKEPKINKSQHNQHSIEFNQLLFEFNSGNVKKNKNTEEQRISAIRSRIEGEVTAIPLLYL
jgi:hypothetical protein